MKRNREIFAISFWIIDIGSFVCYVQVHISRDG